MTSNLLDLAVIGLVILQTLEGIRRGTVPAWALTKRGSSDASTSGSVPASDQQGLQLFQINCGSCHTLAAAGTDGVIGPNLDQLLATGPKSADTVKGEQAKAVARFVADNVAYIGGSTSTPSTP